MADIQLYLGLDLGPEYTQLSFYNVDTHEPESVYHEEAKDTYMLPNILFYSAYHKRAGTVQDGCFKFIDLAGWCAGAKASAYRFEENGTVVDQIYQKTIDQEDIEVEGKQYKAGEILVKLMALQIKQFTDHLDGFVIKRLTVTVADTSPRIIQAVRGLKSALRLRDDEFNIVSHLDSGLCYIFAQPEPLRNNSVGLFDFGRDGLNFYRIDLTRKYPLIVSVQHTDYRDHINMRKFGRNYEDMDEAFVPVVREAMGEVFISSVFLTGVGFVESWMKQSAAVLCQGRRVFVGQNIYTKGACFRSLGGTYTEALGRYFIDTEETVKNNIGINLRDGKNTFWPIVYGGNEWFNTRGRVELFPDESRRIQIVYQDILTEEEWYETIEIHGLPARPKKTTKLSIEVEYSASDKGAIVIRDLGFGSLYPTTNKIYRKEFDISALKRKFEEKQRADEQSEAVRAAEGETDELRAEPEKSDATNADTAIPEAVVYYGTASPQPESEAELEPDIEMDPEMDPEPGVDSELETAPDMEGEPDAVEESDEQAEPEFQEDVEYVPDDAVEVIPEQDIEYDWTDEEDSIDQSDDESDQDEPDLESDNEDDEPVVQSAFNIPSYLRGQHFDPGE